MIQLTQGLVNSLIILELLRNDERLNKLNFNVYVNCFQNCREMGLTFSIGLMTYCIYEHRNSDQIIINVKKNWCGHSGDLPYMTGDKWTTIATFGSGKYDECAEYLIDLLLNYKEDDEKSNIATIPVTISGEQLDEFRNAFKMQKQTTDDILVNVIIESLLHRYGSPEYFQQEDFIE